MKIVGIILVQNEDLFVAQAIHNVAAFCDQILLVDHQSSDGTVAILQQFQKQDCEKFSLHQITDPYESHDLLKPFVGTATWVFGVDGDEIYDPEGLLRLKQRLLSGEFQKEWMIVGNVLHVDQLEEAASTAFGYLAPPSRSVTKLYNFSAIDGWDGDTPERLHGGTLRFRAGFHEQKKYKLNQEESWQDASLRCLHCCFLPRSSVSSSRLRKNCMEIRSIKSWELLRKFFYKLRRLPEPRSWKQEHYMRGERVVTNVTSFFNKNF